MRTLKHLTFCLAAAFIATGCSQEDNEPQTTVKKGTPAEFTMTINGGTGTRTITTHNEENRTISWREGDEVGIFAVSSDGTQSNRKYTYNNNEWKAVSVSDAITLTEGTDYTFYAYYPYTANITAAAASLNVLPDQSTQGEGNSSYDLSDVLISKVNESTYNGDPITLNYSHAYAMVEVLITGDKVGDTAPQKVVLKNVITDANIDLTTQIITNTTNKQDVIMSYVANTENTGTYLYRAIVPEQIMTQGSTLLEVYGVNSGKNYTFKAPKDITYPQGKYFRMEVTIGQNNAGIKFPKGDIDPWAPTPGIDLEGEEIKVQLITIPISSLTDIQNDATADNIDVTKLNIVKETIYNTNNNFWYALNNYSGETLKEVSINSLENAISYQMDQNMPAYSWFKTGIGYHCNLKEIAGFKPGYYKLTFNLKSDNATQENPVVLRTIIRSTTDKEYIGLNANKDVFFTDNTTPGKTYFDFTLKTNDWAKEPYTTYINFKKIGTYTGGTTISDVLADDEKIYQECEIKFRFNKEKGGNILIKDVQLEYIDESDLPQ